MHRYVPWLLAALSAADAHAQSASEDPAAVEASDEVITVEGTAPRTTPGATVLSRDDLARLPGTSNDLVQSLAILPGVTVSPGFVPIGFSPYQPASGLVIRGASPQDSRFVLDGFEVPFLFHTIGFRSILPTASIASLDYIPGGFDVAFGRATSGVVSITTRRAAGSGGEAELSVVDGGALARGPLGERGSYVVAARRSTIDLILPAVLPDDAEVSLTTYPRYYDAQTRLDLELAPRWQLALSAIGADDAIAGTDTEDDSDVLSRTRFARVIADARWHRRAWTASVAGSVIGAANDFEFGGDRFSRMRRAGATLRSEVARSAAEELGLRDVAIRAGGELDVTRWRIAAAMPRLPDEGEPPSTGGPGDGDVTERFDETLVTPNLAAWTAIGAGIGPRVRLTAGVRADAFLRNDDVAIQPRADLAITARADTTIRFAAGRYHRPPEHGDELRDAALRSEASTQFIAGVEHRPLAGIELEASAYYTDRTRLLTRASDGGFENQGRGTTYGAELAGALRHGPWFGWLAYTYAHSTRRDQPMMTSRLFDYDQPHHLEVAASWRSGAWQLGARFQYLSGMPYTPVAGAIYDSDADRYVPQYGPANSARIPAHHQFNVRVDRTWVLGSVKLTGYLEVQNVYLNSSIVEYDYSFDYTERSAEESLPILPWLGVRGEL